VIEATDIKSLKMALEEAKKQSRTTVITIETDLYKSVPGYGWWEVAVSEVSQVGSVTAAYAEYKESKKKQKYFLRNI
jgi:3D-(3,5/4)-trihydroxycyclohexane-1,2-dione acylhydrolase (decyclizing)